MNEALAENIRALREQLCWTQEQLAEAAQVHHRTIQRAEAAQCGFRPMAIAETGGWRSPKTVHGDHRNRAWRSPKPGMAITENGDGDRLS